jgi:predicted RNA-binding protein with PIN domain
MIVVVDAYNVLKQVVATGDITQRERNNFISQLGKYATIKKHTIVLVFDGGAHDRVFKEQVAGIQVVYSGPHQTADHYIAEYLTKIAGKEIVLASSDRELNSQADDLGVASIGAQDFYEILQSTLRDRDTGRDSGAAHKTQGQIVKLHEDSNPGLDALMQEAAYGAVIKKEDIRGSTASLDSKKPTRVDRQLLKVLKKL